MYVKRDSLGHDEICDGDPPSDLGFSLKSMAKGAWSGIKRVGVYAIPGYGQFKLAKDVTHASLKAAAAPIIASLKPAVRNTSNYIAREKGRPVPTTDDVADAKRAVLKTLTGSHNKFYKLGGKILIASGWVPPAKKTSASAGMSEMGFAFVVTGAMLAVAGTIAALLTTTIVALSAAAKANAKSSMQEQAAPAASQYELPDQDE